MPNDQENDTVFRLVLVEDQDADRAAVRERLEHVAKLSCQPGEQWQVIDFADPDEAIRYLDAPPPNALPDILICDLDFSGCQDGIRLVEHASNLPDPVPCLVLSQSTDRDLRSDCFLAGALSYVNKMELENLDDEAIRQVLSDVIWLSRGRVRFRQVSDWKYVLNGSVTLGHDLLRALDENIQKFDAFVSGESPVERDEAARDFRDGHKFVRTIIQDFTDAPHIIRQSISDEDFCVRDLVDRLVASTTPYWKRRYRKVTLAIDVTGTPRCLTRCNQARARRALSNVIDNAVKFSPNAASVQIDISDHRGDEEEVFWAVMIVDNGPGVPIDQLNAIATPLVRLEHTAHLPGTGFGLHSCVDLMRPYSSSLGGCPNPRFRAGQNRGLEVTLFFPKLASEEQADEE